jgi:cob(I)alamin adenosyltransferase
MTAAPVWVTAPASPKTHCEWKQWVASMSSTARSEFWCRWDCPSPAAIPCLTEIQHDLFDLGGELAIPGAPDQGEQRLAWLEAQVEQFNATLPPLKEFVLPGGGTAAAACHVARAVCRRAERRCWSLSRSEKVDSASLRYLNRLSDLLLCWRVYLRAPRPAVNRLVAAQTPSRHRHERALRPANARSRQVQSNAWPWITLAPGRDVAVAHQPIGTRALDRQAHSA